MRRGALTRMKMATVLGARASGPPEAMRARGPRTQVIFGTGRP
jgi:hypothetical protein